MASSSNPTSRPPPARSSPAHRIGAIDGINGIALFTRHSSKTRSRKPAQARAPRRAAHNGYARKYQPTPSTMGKSKNTRKA